QGQVRLDLAGRRAPAVAVPADGRGGLLPRDLDVEGRAGLALRLDPDTAVDPADELPADVEAETGAADAAGHVGVEAVELLEDPALLGRRDAQAVIGDGEADVALARLDGHGDRAAVGGVLDGVVDEVPEHLAELSGVGGD